jgi:hypothetical protein
MSTSPRSDISLGILIVGAIINFCLTAYEITVLKELRNKMKRYSNLPMAFAIVPTLRARKATNPRDLCYGFYGVLKAEGLSQLKKPDYEKEERQVFKEFLLDLLRWDGRALALLLDCCKFEEPSWAPDWRMASKQSWLNNEYFYGLSDTWATTKSSPHFDITDDEVGIIVYGKMVNNASIVWTSAEMTLEGDKGANSEAEIELWNLKILMDWLSVGLQEYLDSEVIDIPLVKQLQVFEALEAELAFDSTAAEDELFSTAINALKDLKSLRKLSNGFISWFKALRPFLNLRNDGFPKEENNNSQQDVTDEQALLNDWSRTIQCYRRLLDSHQAILYHRRICSEIIGRRLLFIFSSSNGVHCGTGSIAMEMGDKLYLISGLPVPILLRGVGSRSCVLNKVKSEREAFAVVGPVFISRMMRGEIWPKAGKDEQLTKEQLSQFYLV